MDIKRRIWQSVLLLAVIAGLVAGNLRVLQESVAVMAQPSNKLPDVASAVTVRTQAELQQALNQAVYGTTILVANDIRLTAPLTLNKNDVAVKLQTSGGTVTLSAPSTRHFHCSGRNLDLFLDGIVLDGGKTGGGIYSSVAGLSLSGAVVRNCYSSGNGGGIEAVSGTLQVEQGTVLENNRAAAYGGGISTGAGVSLQLDGGEISGNTAGAYGGGIFGGVACTIRMDGGAVQKNSAVLGGGIYCGLSGYLLLDGGEIAENQAGGTGTGEGKGGGIYAVTSDLLLDGVSITGNTANDGGGIYVSGDGSDIVLADGIIQGNKTSGEGGGVYLDTAYSTPNTFTINAGTLGGNEAGHGGGVFASGSKPSAGSTNYGGSVASTVSSNGGEISGNTATTGGGICAREGVSVQIWDGTLGQNSASSGGAVWIQPLENLTVEKNVVFRENTADTAVHYPVAADIVLHGRNIKTERFTGSFRFAYNNFDVVYEGGEPVQHTVRFDYQDDLTGQERETQRSVLHGNNIDTLPSPGQPGYGFQGWFTKPSGGTQWNAESVVTGDITLYAQWQPRTYTLHFNYNGAEPVEGFESKTVTYGQWVGYLPIAVHPDGTAFAGWYDQDQEPYFSATVYGVEGDTTLYARWVPSDITWHTVTFDYKGGSGDEAQRRVEDGTVLGRLPVATRNGYTLQGWYDESGAKYAASTRIYGDLELYANWELASHTVTFHANGGEEGGWDKTKQVRHGQAIGALPEPERHGYDFTGWYTLPENGEQVDENTLVTDDWDLFAGWEPERYYLHFDYQGETVEEFPDRKEVMYGHMIGSLPVPGREGHFFAGWFTQPGDAGRYIGGGTSGYPYDRTQDSTVYAGWHGNTYTLFFQYAGADEIEMLQKTVLFGDNVGYLPFPEREGYRFAGWFTGPDGQGRQYFVGTTYSAPDDLTLYAYWVPDEETEAAQNPERRIPGKKRADSWEMLLDSIEDDDIPYGDNPNTGAHSLATMWSVAGLLLTALAGVLWWKRER